MRAYVAFIVASVASVASAASMTGAASVMRPRVQQKLPTRHVFCYPYRHPCPTLVLKEAARYNTSALLPRRRRRQKRPQNFTELLALASKPDVISIGGRRVSFQLPSKFSGRLRLVIGVFSLKLVGRSFVRNSWARELRSDDMLCFLTSQPTGGPDARLLEDEAAVYGDLFRFDLDEAYVRRGTYSSLPFKALSFYSACVAHLRFDFLLKTDDE